MNWFKSFFKGDLVGVHLAVNVFIATAVLWLLLRTVADLNPIWAISSMIASVDPDVNLAYKNFRARLINAMLGCAVGLLVLVVGGSSEWTLPFALAATALLSAYVVRITVMWRQAPITAALVIASSLEEHSKLSGIEIGLHRVGEVILGCIVGLLVTWLVSKFWPPPKVAAPKS
ncbi:MAG TPA: FUSC family protein [Verrucomicrobiae bacterium]|nr:FUSC family protein [Verrucomicrobiae bacterium]